MPRDGVAVRQAWLALARRVSLTGDRIDNASIEAAAHVMRRGFTLEQLVLRRATSQSA